MALDKYKVIQKFRIRIAKSSSKELAPYHTIGKGVPEMRGVAKSRKIVRYGGDAKDSLWDAKARDSFPQGCRRLLRRWVRISAGVKRDEVGIMAAMRARMETIPWLHQHYQTRSNPYSKVQTTCYTAIFAVSIARILEWSR